jgi:hypothetical protein
MVTSRAGITGTCTSRVTSSTACASSRPSSSASERHVAKASAWPIAARSRVRAAPARAPAMQQRLARGLDVAVVGGEVRRTSSDTGSSRIRFSIIPAVRR